MANIRPTDTEKANRSNGENSQPTLDPLPTAVMEPQPYEPSQNERTGYYFGLAGNPQLIARTGTERWQSPSYYVGTFAGKHKKYLAGINQPGLVDKWTKALCYRIIEALKDCPWEYFFPIRVGIDTLTNSNQIKQSGLSTVLMIGAPKNHLDWEQAVKFALDCRQVLLEFHIEDIEVEIRDGGYQKQALETQVDFTAAHYKKTNDQALRLMPYSGFPIGYLDPRKGQGSMGPFIKLGNNPEVYGLTCRHVVQDERQPHESYLYSTGERQGHIYGNADTYDDVYDKLSRHKKNLMEEGRFLETKHTQWEEWYQHEPGREHLRPSDEESLILRRLMLEFLYHRQIFETIKTMKDRSSRSFGNLAFHSSSEISSHQKGYLKDWALIEMDKTKFSQDTKSKVIVGNRLLDFISDHDLTKSPSFFENYSYGVLTLRGDNQKQPKPQQSFYVAKRGARTGLTFGQVNGIEAVVRQPGHMSDCYSWELIVVPEPGGSPFSSPGDSGSCVFDLEGRVIGMLVGSNRQNDPERPWERGLGLDADGSRQIKMHPDQNMSPEEAPKTDDNAIKPWLKDADISFVTPIQWVLDDMEEFTGQKPQVI